LCSTETLHFFLRFCNPASRLTFLLCGGCSDHGETPLYIAYKTENQFSNALVSCVCNGSVVGKSRKTLKSLAIITAYPQQLELLTPPLPLARRLHHTSSPPSLVCTRHRTNGGGGGGGATPELGGGGAGDGGGELAEGEGDLGF